MENEYFENPQEIWDKAKCEKYARSNPPDAYGNRRHYRVEYDGPSGITTYNGGCVREGTWYRGEIHHLPRVAAGFEFVYVDAWGYRLKKTS